MKVLLKFKLLEVQRQPTHQFTQWAMKTPYFQQIRQHFFADIPMRQWIEQLCNELTTTGVAGHQGEYLVNL